MLSGLTETPARSKLDIAIQSTNRPLIMATQGYAAP